MAKREMYEAMLKRVAEMRANAEKFVAELEAAGITGLRFNSASFDEQEQAIKTAMAALP